MKIGVMLRHIGQHGGRVLVYTYNLLKSLFDLQSEHEFVLMYKDPDSTGTFANFENVTEDLIECRSLFLWDHIAVWKCHKAHRFDVIFNPKYSVPLLADCPTVFVCHGLDWYVMPFGSKLPDRINHRLLIPRYARKAARIVAVFDTARAHLTDYLYVGPAQTRHIWVSKSSSWSL